MCGRCVFVCVCLCGGWGGGRGGKLVKVLVCLLALAWRWTCTNDWDLVLRIYKRWVVFLLWWGVGGVTVVMWVVVVEVLELRVLTWSNPNPLSLFIKVPRLGLLLETRCCFGIIKNLPRQGVCPSLAKFSIKTNILQVTGSTALTTLVLAYNVNSWNFFSALSSKNVFDIDLCYTW